MKPLFHLVLIGGVLLFLAGCYDDVETLPPLPPDSVAPNAVSQESLRLSADTSDAGRVALRFIAPGDPQGGKLLAVSRYEIAVSTHTLVATDQEAFAKARVIKEPDAPKAPGEEELFSLTGLEAATDYWIGLRSFDRAGNVSLITVGQVTTYDPRPLPAPTEFVLSNAAPSPAIELRWAYSFSGKGRACKAFELTRKDESGKVQGVFDIAAVAGTSAYVYLDQDPSLIPDTAYTYSLAAKNDDERSEAVEGSLTSVVCLTDAECGDAASGYGCDMGKHCRLIPQISLISPEPAEFGETLTFVGKGFGVAGQSGEAILVSFDTTQADAVSSGNAEQFQLVLPELPLQSDEITAVPVLVSVAGLRSASISLRVHAYWPRITAITPDVAAPGEVLTIRGRHFTLGGASVVRVHFTPDGCALDATPSAEDRLTLSLPACARSGPVTLTVNGKNSRPPQAGIVVKGYAESTLALDNDPPLSAAFSPDASHLAVLTASGLRYYEVGLGGLSERHCGQGESSPCVPLNAPLLAGFSAADGFAAYVFGAGATPYLRRIEFPADRDFANSAPTSIELACPAELASLGHQPTKLIADTKRGRLLVLSAGRVLRYDLGQESMAAVSDSALSVLDLALDPFGRYGYALISLGGTYHIGVLDLIEGSQRQGKQVALLRQGSAALQMAIDPYARRLAIADPNDASPHLLSFYDIADPERPIDETPIINVPALSRLAFSADGALCFGSDATGRSFGFAAGTEETPVPLFDESFAAPLDLQSAPDGSRLALLHAKGLALLSLNRAAPLLLSLSPFPLVRGESAILTLANEACREASNVVLITSDEKTIPLIAAGERRFVGQVPDDLKSGDLRLRCDGHPDSRPWPFLVGLTHRYEGFLSTWTIDGVHLAASSSGTELILRNDHPGDFGFISLVAEGPLEAPAMGLAPQNRSLLASLVHDDTLFAIGLQKGAFAIDLATKVLLFDEGPTPENPAGLALDPTNENLLSTDALQNTLFSLNLASGKSATPRALPSCVHPVGLASRRDANGNPLALIACNGNSKLLAIALNDPADAGLSGALAFAPNALTTAAPDGSRLFVFGDDRVSLTQTAIEGDFAATSQLFVTGATSAALWREKELWFVSAKGLQRFTKLSSDHYGLTAEFPVQALSIGGEASGPFALGLAGAGAWVLY